MVTVTMSLAMKINLGNYESAEAFVSLSGVDETTTLEDIQFILDGPGKIAYDELKARLGERISAMRRKE